MVDRLTVEKTVNRRPEAPAGREARHGAARNIRQRARQLLSVDGLEKIAAAREWVPFDFGGREVFEVMLFVPRTVRQNASFPNVCDTEDVYRRTVVARPGALENLVVEVDRLCDGFDPAGMSQGAIEAAG